MHENTFQPYSFGIHEDINRTIIVELQKFDGRYIAHLNEERQI